MKYIVKSKRVNVRPYQRKGKYVIGYQRLDPRNKKLGQPFMTQQTLEEMKYNPEETEFWGVAERVASEEQVKSKEPEYVNVPPDIIKSLQALIPREELDGIRSIEEFSFHDFTKCATLPKSLRDETEKGYQEHPDYGGMYYHDVAKLVIDSTNKSFQRDRSYKEYAMLHEIGHHQWWYHITPEDATRYEDIWDREKVSDYAGKDSGEGFAEAYAHYRAGMLDVTTYPETYKFCSEVFDLRRLQKKEGRKISIEPFSTAPKEKLNLAKQLELAFNDFARSRGFTKKVAGDYAFLNKKNKMFKLIRTRRDGTITVWEEGVGRYDLHYVEEQ